jgi:ketosteroid isomerase-like protein
VSQGSQQQGDTAIVGSESEIRTTIKGKPVSLRSREVLNLKKIRNVWKIVAIHWQSSPLTEKAP